MTILVLILLNFESSRSLICSDTSFQDRVENITLETFLYPECAFKKMTLELLNVMEVYQDYSLTYDMLNYREICTRIVNESSTVYRYDLATGELKEQCRLLQRH